MTALHRDTPNPMPLGAKLWHVNWAVVVLLSTIAGVGFATLYSAADGSWQPWAGRQAIRFAVSLVLMLTVALVDLRLWMRAAYPAYFGALALLVAVEFLGTGAMGAQRWIDLRVVQLQPSELMKIALVMALARYFHAVGPEEIGRPTYLVVPMLLTAAPAVLVLRQPDLGTAGMLVLCAAAVFLLAGVRLWKFALVIAAGIAAVPFAWQFLHGYQKRRVLAFLDPQSDPLGFGYHILQSKIALGSGGMFGKGFMQGTQSHLNFLPEKQTDFIFTMFSEEFGFFGGIGLLALYVLLMIYGMIVSLRAQNQFGRLVAGGVTFIVFLYVFINIAMVIGLVPVVGVPLPLISYGGTAMLSVLLGFGLVMSVDIHREYRIPRRGPQD